MHVYVITAAMAAMTAESVVKAICESSGDGSAYENETEDEALVDGGPDVNNS